VNHECTRILKIKRADANKSKVKVQESFDYGFDRIKKYWKPDEKFIPPNIVNLE